MDLDKDRIGRYLVAHLDNFIFDELSDAYLEKAKIADIMTGVPVPLKKTELGSMSTLGVARNMAFVIGCDPEFKYRDNYINYILRTFDKKFAEGLIGDGVEGASKRDYDYACIQFRAAMQIDPDNADAYYCYGRACKDAYELGEEEEYVGRFKAESLEAFETATIKNPKHAEALYFLGYGYVNMGLYVKAKLTWQSFLECTDNDELRQEISQRLETLEEPVNIEKGYNLILSEKYQEGIEALLPYKEGTFSTWWPLWYYLGIAYKGIGDEEMAIHHFKEVLKYSPSNMETMKELISLYQSAGNQEMVDKYTKKIEIVKENEAKDRKLAADADGSGNGKVN